MQQKGRQKELLLIRLSSDNPSNAVFTVAKCYYVLQVNPYAYLSCALFNRWEIVGLHSCYKTAAVTDFLLTVRLLGETQTVAG